MMAKNLTPFGNELQVPDFAAFSKSCGAKGFKVTDAKDLEDTLKEALLIDEPCLIDVETADAALPYLQQAEQTLN